MSRLIISKILTTSKKSTNWVPQISISKDLSQKQQKLQPLWALWSSFAIVFGVPALNWATLFEVILFNRNIEKTNRLKSPTIHTNLQTLFSAR